MTTPSCENAKSRRDRFGAKLWRFRWGIGTLLTVGIVPTVVPTERISLAGAELQGAIGSYGNGIGWVAIPNVHPIGDRSDYDLGNLMLHSKLTEINGFTLSTSLAARGSVVASASFGAGGSNLAASLSVDGASNYQWNWTPPQPPGGGSALTFFGAQPLFVLGRIDIDTHATATDPTVHGDLMAADGWNAGPFFLHFNGPFPIVPLAPGIASITRKILTPDITFNTASTYLSPSATASGYVLNANGAYGLGSIDLRLSDVVLPISLSGINPFGLPQLGVNINKVVFTGDPVGILGVPMSATIGDAFNYPSADDMNYILNGNHVGWNFDTPNHPGEYTPVPYNKRTIGSLILPTTGPGFNDGAAYYQGLPANNSDFGRKNLWLKVDGDDSTSASVETFYSAHAWNHPNQGSGLKLPDGFPLFTADGSRMVRQEGKTQGIPVPLPSNGTFYSRGTTQNFYYYYSQAYTAPDSVMYQQFWNQARSTTYAWYPLGSNGRPIDPYTPMQVETICIGNDADRLINAPIFVVGADGYLKVAGEIWLRGLQAYAWICAHEAGHAADIKAGRVNEQYQKVDYQVIQHLDEDSDCIPNDIEAQNHLDRSDPDTTGYYSETPQRSTGDVEVLANIHAWGELKNNKALWEQDWADQGLQFMGLDDPQWGPHHVEETWQGGLLYYQYWGLPNVRGANGLAAAQYHPWNFVTKGGNGALPNAVLRTDGEYNCPDPPAEAVDTVVGTYPGP